MCDRQPDFLRRVTYISTVPYWNNETTDYNQLSVRPNYNIAHKWSSS